MLKTAWCCVTGGVKHKDLVLLLESIRYIGHDRESSVLLLRRGLHVCLGDWEEGKRSAWGKMGRANRRREAFPSSHHSLRPRYFLIISTFFGILRGRAFAEESGESLITAPQDTAPTLSTGAKIFDRWNSHETSVNIPVRYFSVISFLVICQIFTVPQSYFPRVTDGGLVKMKALRNLYRLWVAWEELVFHIRWYSNKSPPCAWERGTEKPRRHNIIKFYERLLTFF